MNNTQIKRKPTNILEKIFCTEHQTDEDSFCPGIVFKGVENRYINNRGDVVFTERLVLQKRLSCPGCKECGPLHDQFQECFDEGLIEIPKIEHGTYYTVGWNYYPSTSFEFEDDWELYISEIDKDRINYIKERKHDILRRKG